VRQESLAIDAQYEKKHKQAEVGWKMCVLINRRSLSHLSHSARNPHRSTPPASPYFEAGMTTWNPYSRKLPTR